MGREQSPGPRPFARMAAAFNMAAMGEILYYSPRILEDDKLVHRVDPDL